MSKAVTPITTLEAIDDDLRSACAQREAAFTKLMVKDTQVNRDAYRDACTAVDSLLEMRHGLVGR
jgi:hypothetical protein